MSGVFIDKEGLMRALDNEIDKASDPITYFIFGQMKKILDKCTLEECCQNCDALEKCVSCKRREESVSKALKMIEDMHDGD